METIGIYFDDYPDILNVQDLREILGIGKNSAYQLCRDGAIECRKPGGHWRIAKDAVIRYLSANEDALYHN
ncbi:helix-turn-helix domain-containing protein [Ruminococcaceae bacterium OttesenSCG-928-A11]|nr:helix-turn-helix domain-containing protein [Ruminococcaceae bacterium OttesenSCG-928-A11]